MDILVHFARQWETNPSKLSGSLKKKKNLGPEWHTSLYLSDIGTRLVHGPVSVGNRPDTRFRV